MKDIFIAKSADLIGDITLGERANIWYQAVIRADINHVTIGDETNVQDGTVIHVDDEFPVVIGKNITIGHQCLIHGCTIHDGALIGMGSTIMNGSVIGENCLVGAGSLVTEGKEFPPNTLIMGRPAKVVRELTEAEIRKNHLNTQHYVQEAAKYLAGEYGDQNKAR